MVRLVLLNAQVLADDNQVGISNVVKAGQAANGRAVLRSNRAQRVAGFDGVGCGGRVVGHRRGGTATDRQLLANSDQVRIANAVAGGQAGNRGAILCGNRAQCVAGLDRVGYASTGMGGVTSCHRAGTG